VTPGCREPKEAEMGTNRHVLITGAGTGMRRTLAAAGPCRAPCRGRGPAAKDPGSLGTLVSIAFRDSSASGETLLHLVPRRAFDGLASDVGLACLHLSVDRASGRRRRAARERTSDEPDGAGDPCDAEGEGLGPDRERHQLETVRIVIRSCYATARPPSTVRSHVRRASRTAMSCASQS
jgi:hypothetical protein